VRLKSLCEHIPAPLLGPLLLLLAYLLPSLLGLISPWPGLGLPAPATGVLDLFYSGTKSPFMLTWSICIFSGTFSGLYLLQHIVVRGYDETSFLVCTGAAILAALFNRFLVFGMLLPALLHLLIGLDLVTVYYESASYSGSSRTDMLCLVAWFLIVLVMAAVSRGALLFYRADE